MDRIGLFAGIVEKNDDPEKLGRLKVRVPHVYGISGSQAGAVTVDDLPWALPFGLPAGLSGLSGGISWLPEIGDQVLVHFLDGECHKPVWTWFMQTVEAAKNFKLHNYGTGTGGQVASPQSARLTRYGHTIEFSDSGIIATTAHGYSLLLTDGSESDGEIMLQTELGNFLQFSDGTNGGTLNILEDFYMQIGLELNIQCDSLRFVSTTGDADLTVGNDLILDVTGDINVTGLGAAQIDFADTVNLTASGDMALITEANMSLQFTALELGLGATEPFVLGNQLVGFLESLLAWLSTHTHTSDVPGAPTTPPIVPPEGTVEPDPALLISETIFGG